MTQIFREIHASQNLNGTFMVVEVWRGNPEEYKIQAVPPNTFRFFEMYIFGSGWFRVDQPNFTTTLGETNPTQNLME